MGTIDTISIIFTTYLLIVVFSYYVLLILKERKPPHHKKHQTISIIIPAHNEERYIESSINSVVNAKFDGVKQIIVADDGSSDKTYEIISNYDKSKLNEGDTLLILKTKHTGKSATLNSALEKATGSMVAIVDGDSVIDRNALMEISDEMSRKNVSAVSCVVKVKNRKNFFGMWFHIEQIYVSLIRSILSKVNANITTPGPLSVYRRDDLMEVGGFSTEGFSEDADITIKLIRKGKKVIFSERAISETNMPEDIKGILRQRTRFARGSINLLKRHLKVNNCLIDMYTLPLLFFNYVQSVIMGSITIYQLYSGYKLYFYSQGIIFNTKVFLFFFEWFSMYGFAKWTYQVFVGIAPLNLLSAVAIISSLLSYPLYFYAVYKFDKKFDLRHLIPLVFMFPFWFANMIIYILCVPEIFMKQQYNRWKKNE